MLSIYQPPFAMLMERIELFSVSVNGRTHVVQRRFLDEEESRWEYSSVSLDENDPAWSVIRKTIESGFNQ